MALIPLLLFQTTGANRAGNVSPKELRATEVSAL